jgi:dihydrofolate reductase
VGKTIMSAVVSLDGYIARDDDSVGPLFDWYGNGDVEWTWTDRPDEPASRTTRASRDFVKSVYPRIGAVVIGRRLFDQTDGWGGVPAAGDHVFVVTHTPPTDWKHAETAPFTFVDGVAAAIAQARELAGRDRIVDVSAGEIGGQALRLGLIDQVVMNVVPVVFGAGRPFFGAMGAGEPIVLADPSRVVQGDRVTHLLYDVVRS